tara:strand:+ start:749 stop:946 length:198 start_codon:yes stop_codon:yes gene_type:complete
MILKNMIWNLSFKRTDEMRAYSKETKKEIKELLKDHVESMRRNIPWTGENDLVTKKIINLFRKTA